MADALRGNPLRGTRGSQSAEIAQGNAEIAQGKKAREGSRRVETGGAALELNEAAVLWAAAAECAKGRLLLTLRQPQTLCKWQFQLWYLGMPQTLKMFVPQEVLR